MSTPPHTQVICRRLFGGYQYSPSDYDRKEYNHEYTVLRREYAWFQEHLALSGFTLEQEDEVIFLVNEDKSLSKEEKQTIVVLFLLADLYLEKGHGFNDLFLNRISWRELDWFREGYGRDYLIQVGIEDESLIDIEKLFGRMDRKGLVAFDNTTGMVTLRRPAERILNMARTLYKLIETGVTADESA